MFKRCKVVMLPTKNKATDHCITKSMTSSKLFYNSTENMARLHLVNEGASIEHLYILSDDEIKGDDYIYNIVLKAIEKAEDTCVYANRCFRKIIATTDESLGLPKPSDSFIKKYIEEYNKGNQITDVMVEYEEASNYIHPPQPYFNWLKISSDNTITIRKVKNSWNREEVISLIKEFRNGLAFTTQVEIDYTNNWIKENL